MLLSTRSDLKKKISGMSDFQHTNSTEEHLLVKQN